MVEAKTKPTSISVASYLAAIPDESRRKDYQEIAALMERITGCQPQMWGTSIVGFNQYHYKYASGHEGDAAVVGFSSRKGDITIYLDGFDGDETKSLLSKLGKHKTGKVCLYIKHLNDVDRYVLEKLIIRSVAETRKRCPTKKP